MKLHEICNVNEMAYKGGDLRSQADEYAKKQEVNLKDAKHVGDIEEFQVKKKGLIFSLWKDDELVALASLDPIPNAYAVVDDLWVKDTFRNQKLLSKLLWFFKSRENHPKLLLGKLHSDDTYNVLKAGGLSKFKRYWFDPISSDTAEFDRDTIDEFYKGRKSSWTLMLEQTDDQYLKNMPRFNNLESGFVKMCYNWQIE
jgi:hypothetical protein